MEPTDYEQIYRDGSPPWDHGEPDFNLAEAVEQFSIQPCKALDLGCGRGNNTIWLARHGFDVHGFDLSATAIAHASERVDEAGLECSLQVGNFLRDPPECTLFGFVFDRGCLHCIHDAADRVAFVENVASALREGGHWLSLIGNADEPKREVGPPRMSVREIAASVEPCFEILSLKSGVFGDKQEDPPRAWVCYMRKRTATVQDG